MAAEPRSYDLAVVGGGPAGLAAAIACATAGLSVVVFEKRRDDLDKACGEGLLPPALAALAALGVQPRDSDSVAFHRLRYVLEDGLSCEATLPAGGGRGMRRTALVHALRERARGLAVELREGVSVERFVRHSEGIDLFTGEQLTRCALLVGADGLASTVRHIAKLDEPARGRQRYGLRLHYEIAPWDSAVEVHFGQKVEAYVTPVGTRSVGVAFLWSHRELGQHLDAAKLLRLFPRLQARLGDSPTITRARGAGPFERRARDRTADRVVLIGDAAGYLDPITGEGLALAFRAALSLGECAPRAIALGGGAQTLRDYERAYAKGYRRYVRLTKLVLALSNRGWFRRRLVAWLASHPETFRALIGWGLQG